MLQKTEINNGGAGCRRAMFDSCLPSELVNCIDRENQIFQVYFFSGFMQNIELTEFDRVQPSNIVWSQFHHFYGSTSEICRCREVFTNIKLKLITSIFLPL